MTTKVNGTAPTPVISFHGKKSIKTKYLKRATAHFVADEIVKGQYWSEGKGCAVGCLVHGSSHTQLAAEINIPISMAYLIDRLFEGMPNENAKEFPKRFIESMPVGVDLEPVMDRFYLALLSDPEQGVILSANDGVRPQIQAVIDLYTRQVAGDFPTVDEFSAAYSAADSAAYRAAYRAADSAAYRAAYSAAFSAAYSAAYSAADSAADSAAYSAAYSAADSAAYRAADSAAYSAAYRAADSAADSAAYRAAAGNHFLWQAELLLSLLSTTTPPKAGK